MVTDLADDVAGVMTFSDVRLSQSLRSIDSIWCKFLLVATSHLKKEMLRTAAALLCFHSRQLNLYSSTIVCNYTNCS